MICVAVAGPATKSVAGFRNHEEFSALVTVRLYAWIFLTLGMRGMTQAEKHNKSTKQSICYRIIVKGKMLPGCSMDALFGALGMIWGCFLVASELANKLLNEVCDRRSLSSNDCTPDKLFYTTPDVQNCKLAGG